MKIVMLGCPGAGKGTISKQIINDYSVPHISTGDIFREAIRNKTLTGLKAKEYINAGNLVPDEIVDQLVKERLQKDDCKNGFILDGYPRTIEQAKALNSFSEINHVFNFIIPKEIVIKRISGRRTCPKCKKVYHIEYIKPKKPGFCDVCNVELVQREDEKPEVVVHRLEVYKNQTTPLIDFYKEKSVLFNIDADRSVEEIYADVKNILG